MFRAVWVEFPVQDIERATKFYQTVFESESLKIEADEGVRRRTTLFSGNAEGAGISLTQTANFEPSGKGTLVYLNAGEDLTGHLSRVEAAGGKIIEHKTMMGSAGFYATFHDTEGNIAALYSYK